MVLYIHQYIYKYTGVFFVCFQCMYMSMYKSRGKQYKPIIKKKPTELYCFCIKKKKQKEQQTKYVKIISR